MDEAEILNTQNTTAAATAAAGQGTGEGAAPGATALEEAEILTIQNTTGAAKAAGEGTGEKAAGDDIMQELQAAAEEVVPGGLEGATTEAGERVEKPIEEPLSDLITNHCLLSRPTG